MSDVLNIKINFWKQNKSHKKYYTWVMASLISLDSFRANELKKQLKKYAHNQLALHAFN